MSETWYDEALLTEEKRAEAACKALQLLKLGDSQEAIDRQAYTELAAGRLTGDRAVALWTERWLYYKLEARLRKEMEGA